MRATVFPLSGVRLLCAIGVLTLSVAAGADGQQLSVGTNVNMVGGPAALLQGPPFKIVGDPYLQRQNEPSIGCSSRNPVNCLAAANDYRLVGTPGVNDGKVTGDAWLGIFWSHDAGQSWRSSLLPGFPQDTSAEGAASPIMGLGAAADPTVRPGTNGLLYVSGVAFNRAGESTSNGGKSGSFFVSLYIDDNNTQDAAAPIRYVRTVVVDSGNSGQFLDKPWIAVDIPRAGAGTCTIPGAGGVADQVVPAGIVYAAYSAFLGGSNPHSKILFTRSTDCGRTWDNPVKLNESYGVVSQSAMVSVNPVNGNVMVAWRQFGDPNFQDPGAILVAQSSDLGRTFSKAGAVATLGLANPPPPATGEPVFTSLAFDQASLPLPADPAPTMRMFRSNGYPTSCIGTDGIYRVAWAQRWPTPVDDSRIVISTSSDGATWSTPAVVDPYPGRGHQFMPSIACTADRATIVWYDQRNDNAPAVFGSFWFGMTIFDPIPPPPAHTIDVRAAQSDVADPTGAAFLASTQVSRYQWAVDTTPNATTASGVNGLVQLEYNPVNWPLFAGGQVPFLGDYIDLAPARPFRPPLGTSSGWTYNTDANETGVLHAAWTDNRDIIRPPTTVDWTVWSPPTAPGCSPAAVSNRNQNIYTARLSRGLVIGVEGNSRLVAASGGPTERAFAVFVQNGTTTTRHFKLGTGRVPGGAGSFKSGTALGDLYAEIPPLSTIARTVFVPAGQMGPVVVTAIEVDSLGVDVPSGLAGSALINSDGTAPPPIDGSVATVELHTPSISDPQVSSYANPIYANPTFLNPTFLNPTFLNPTFINPTFINPTFINQPMTTDVTWEVANAGNVASGFNFGAIAASFPANASFQLIINRLYSTPGSNDCGLGQQFNADIQAVINNPVLQEASGGNPLAPDATNATFALAAGDRALVTLRVFHDGGFDPSAVAAHTVSQASNPSGTAAARTAPAIAVPKGGVTAEATSPAGATVTFDVTALDATRTPVPVTCAPTSGSVFGFGTTAVTCSATDPVAGKTSTAGFDVTVADSTPPVLVVPESVSASATGAAGAVVVFAGLSATDNIDGAIATVACTPASGSVFPIGTTSVTCTATDAHGNTGSGTFAVTVRDTAPPAVTVPLLFSMEATSAAGAVVAYSGVSATDAVDGPVAVVACLPASGGTFAIGSTPVVCTATDSSGNSSSASFTVTVRDTTPPAVSVPASITAGAAGASGAVVTYSGVSATDTVDGVISSVSCAPASGSLFVLGSTTVTCSATDSGGNAGSALFTVTVVDRTAPVVTAPGSVTAEATGPSGAVVAYGGATAADAVDGPIATVTCAPASGSVFPIGSTLVTCSATDAGGNTGSSSFTVTVRDTTPPVVTEAATPTTLLWSPNKAMTPVQISGRATDATLVSVKYSVWDEYGTINPAGSVAVNADGTYSFTVKLEAWRRGTDSDGRTYIVTVTATDSGGRTSSATATVKVPHN